MSKIKNMAEDIAEAKGLSFEELIEGIASGTLRQDGGRNE